MTCATKNKKEKRIFILRSSLLPSLNLQLIISSQDFSSGGFNPGGTRSRE